MLFLHVRWNKIGQVVDNNWGRIRFMFRVNPLFLWIYWLIWIIPIFIGIKMFISDGGLIWQRTDKIDANHELVRQLQIKRNPEIIDN